jgi:hypothetical protein
MAATLEALRSGDFVTRERMRLMGVLLLIAFVAAFAWIGATANGLNDVKGRPLGTDFSNVYAAGTYVRDGLPEAPFDPVRQNLREQELFGAATPFYGWHYPPFFLFVAAALATMPYVPALVVWQGVTLVLYLLAIGAVMHTAAGGRRTESFDRLWIVLALAYPAVFVNLGHGHNGLLTAAMLAAALAILDRRPIAAGILLGLLSYKPQFGILIPLALAASGRWRTFAAAAATVAALIAATTLAFGPAIWPAFFASTHFTRTVVLENGDTGWEKIQSVFAMVRMWGGPVPLAYAVQGAVTVVLAAAVAWLWRRRVAFALQAAGLVIAAVLATPYSLDYDMTALAPAIAVLAVHGLRAGFAPYERTALAALWVAPLLARPLAGMLLLPVGVAAMAAVLVLTLHRAMRDAAPAWRSAQYPVG